MKTIKPKEKPTLKELISSAPKEVLEALLLQLADESSSTEKRLHLEFGEADPAQEQKECRQLIHSTIKRNSDRGFVSCRQFPAAAVGAHLVAKRTQKHLDNHNYNHAFHCVLTLLQEMMTLVNCADSSSGELGEIIFYAKEMLKESTENLIEKERDGAFKILQKEVVNKRYDGWSDERVNLMELLESMVVTAPERGVVEALIQQVQSREEQSEYSSRYLEEHLTVLKLNLCQRFDGDEEARRFLVNNSHYPEFRKRLINAALESKDYTQAEKYCKEGEAQDKAYAGLVSNWTKLRAEVYHQSGRIEEWQSMLRSFAVQGDMDALNSLKGSLSADVWRAELPDLLDKMKTSCRFLHPYPDVLKLEELWDRLLVFVKERPHEILRYGTDLAPHYPVETRAIFEQYIRSEAAASSNRNQYRAVCKLIKRLAVLFESQAAQSLVMEFRSAYRNRTAMQDELEKIKFK